MFFGKTCLTGPLSTQGTDELNAGNSPAMDEHPIQGEVKILLVTLCYRNQDKLRPDGPLGLYADYGVICIAVYMY